MVGLQDGWNVCQMWGKVEGGAPMLVLASLEVEVSNEVD